MSLVQQEEIEPQGLKSRNKKIKSIQQKHNK